MYEHLYIYLYISICISIHLSIHPSIYLSGLSGLETFLWRFLDWELNLKSHPFIGDPPLPNGGVKGEGGLGRYFVRWKRGRGGGVYGKIPKISNSPFVLSILWFMWYMNLEPGCMIYSQFHKTLPKSSLLVQMHWISVRFYEMGDMIA